MRKGDQLCILRAEVKTEADALNLLRLVGALTAIGVPLDDDCPYLETRELVEGAERRLVTWTLKAKSICGQHDARKLIEAWHDPVWTTQNAEHPFAYITTAFRNAGLLAAEIGRLAPVALKLARENRQAFEDEYLLPFELELPVTAMFTAMQQLENNLTAIEAAQIEVITRPSGSKKEPTPPPN